MSSGFDGKHQVSIGEGCAYTGTVIHELMHAIGKTMSTQKGNIVILVSDCISNLYLFDYL